MKLAKSASILKIKKALKGTDKFSILLANFGIAITTARQQANRVINIELVKANF